MKRVPVGTRNFALVDDADYRSVIRFRWTMTKSGYAIASMRDECGITIKQEMHRFLLSMSKDDPRDVDHINHNKLDNRRVNIHPVSRQQNMWNVKGVQGYRRLPSGKFEAQIQCADQHRISLGVYATAEHAHVAYKIAKLRYHVMPFRQIQSPCPCLASNFPLRAGGSRVFDPANGLAG